MSKDLLNKLKKRKVGSRSSYKNRAKVMEVVQGVNMSWLGAVFDLGENKLRRRLEGVKPIRVEGEIPYYSLKEVAPLLGGITEDRILNILESVKPADLPTKIQKAFWDALRTRQTYMKEAGDLWHTEDVKDVILETFILIRSSMNLWLTELERKTEVSNEQQKLLQDLVARLLDEISDQIRGNFEKDTRFNSSFDEVE